MLLLVCQSPWLWGWCLGRWELSLGTGREVRQLEGDLKGDLKRGSQRGSGSLQAWKSGRARRTGLGWQGQAFPWDWLLVGGERGKEPEGILVGFSVWE